MRVDTPSEMPARDVRSPLAIVALILGSMAVAAMIVCIVSLAPPMMPLGFFVAFLMMMFIGMPLVLASIADAGESR